MPNAAPFSADFLRFLVDLKAHNDRDWFLAHEDRYVASVRDPFLAFLADLAPRLQKLNRHFIADPRRTGGSMMRIHRDTRFSKDKAPYKTAVMARMGHRDADETATPSFYVRLEPGNCAAGAGVWRPAPTALHRIREAIRDDGAAWGRIRGRHALGTACTLAGESLKRPPSGFDADDPFIEDIKRKDFALVFRFDDRAITRAAFTDELLATWKSCAPFLGFVTKAVGLPF